MEKASIIKMKKNVSSKIELAKSIIDIYLCFNKLSLSETENTVLAYFMVYGVSPKTKGLIVKSAVCKNINNVKTVMTKLKRLELIYKDEEITGKVLVSKSLAVELTPTLAIYLKLDVKPE